MSKTVSTPPTPPAATANGPPRRRRHVLQSVESVDLHATALCLALRLADQAARDLGRDLRTHRCPRKGKRWDCMIQAYTPVCQQCELRRTLRDLIGVNTEHDPGEFAMRVRLFGGTYAADGLFNGLKRLHERAITRALATVRPVPGDRPTADDGQADDGPAAPKPALVAWVDGPVLLRSAEVLLLLLSAAETEACQVVEDLDGHRCVTPDQQRGGYGCQVCHVAEDAEEALTFLRPPLQSLSMELSPGLSPMPQALVAQLRAAAAALLQTHPAATP